MLFEKCLSPLIVAILLVLMAFLEWCRYLFNYPPMPIIFTLLAVIAIVFTLIKMRAVLREASCLKLGIVGEEAVGQYLEEKLRPMGCHVLHDIPGEGFNLDHIVIGPTGVFCIETKTHSKPLHGSPGIQYDGEKVTVDGFSPNRDPIVQAKSAANWLRELIERTTGRKFAVKPIVLYPGWFVKKMPQNADVWVLNHKVLPTFISNNQAKLAVEDVALITFHLKRYVISEMERRR